ncbi:hypothetical protein [Gulosibacter molinativorax]|uniref:Thioredoxin family protein n=1 Tax=Gulosibacter molinativorax TaxID=256821 RepID=A0ABT7C6F3_9MICO|nr:hypothetical protein [Gulosibacter molinativorax]MDJ1370772.1 hypothetical protein [Gulosibacter molinativorax]QUY63201.1 Alkylmercury lyase [Gulosibacter molinativorax]
MRANLHRVQVVHIRDCPNTQVATERMRSALEAVGMGETPVETVLVETPEQVAAVTFAGSPTILVDDEDLFPTGATSRDLACRVYVSETGMAGAPSADQIADALRARIAEVQ